MTAKEYLLQYRDAYRQAQDIELRITQLRLKYALPSAIQYSDMPKAHDSNHDLSDYMAKLDALTDRLVNQYCKCMGIEGDILQRIDGMDNKLERQVLLLRYTHVTDKGKLMTWEEVADRVHYTRRTVTNVHGRALQHFPMP